MCFLYWALSYQLTFPGMQVSCAADLILCAHVCVFRALPLAVFIVDSGIAIYVWIGRGASIDEKKRAMEFGHVREHFLKAINFIVEARIGGLSALRDACSSR